MLLRKKYCVNMRVLNLFQDSVISCLKVLVGLGTKDKLLVRTENSSSVNVSEKFFIMFLLYWVAYVLMDLVVNLVNEDLCWSCGKRTFIGGGVYVRFSGV